MSSNQPTPDSMLSLLNEIAVALKSHPYPPGWDAYWCFMIERVVGEWQQARDTEYAAFQSGYQHRSAPETRGEGNDVPRCPKCGYTREDCLILGDHRLCGEPWPPAAPATTDTPAASSEGWLTEDEIKWSQSNYDTTIRLRRMALAALSLQSANATLAAEIREAKEKAARWEREAMAARKCLDDVNTGQRLELPHYQDYKLARAANTPAAHPAGQKGEGNERE